MVPAGGNTRTPAEFPIASLKSNLKRKCSETETADPQNRSGVGGDKIESIAPARQWCFTWHDYPASWEMQFQSLQCKLSGYIIGKEICPDTQRPHLQGWVEMAKKGRPTQLKLAKQIHWEKARGTPQANHTYCTKDANAVSWGSGAAAEPYKVELELYPWEIQLVEHLIETPPDDRHIYWVWEENGCAGKTTFQKYLYTTYTNRRIVVLSGKACDVKNAIVEYKKTSGALPEIVLVNKPRCVEQQYVSFQGLEEIKDMFFLFWQIRRGYDLRTQPSPVRVC